MEIIKPKCLQPGQTVGLLGTASALKQPELLEEAIAAIEARGYHVKLGKTCYARRGYLAGDDALRAADVNAMFCDDTVDGIICIRGGYGSMRILPALDYDAIRLNAKVFSGFSDVTALHSAFLQKAGIVSFHGLMAAANMTKEEMDAYSMDAFWRAVESPAPLGLLENPGGCPRQTILPGQAEGRLIGGNLTLVAACLGTPYAFPFDGSILFLEDVGESASHIDRLLTHLKIAGVFDRVAGVLLGQFTKCGAETYAPEYTLTDVFADTLGNLDIPILAGVACGHERQTLTLPVGIRCAMDATAGTITILESATR